MLEFFVNDKGVKLKHKDRDFFSGLATRLEVAEKETNIEKKIDIIIYVLKLLLIRLSKNRTDSIEIKLLYMLWDYLHNIGAAHESISSDIADIVSEFFEEEVSPEKEG